MVPPLLQVAVVQPGDVAGAEAGGADRLLMSGRRERAGLTPELADVRAVLERASVPLRVVLRLRDDDSTTGGELTRFVGLAAELVEAGVEGFAFGFLTPALDLDVPVTTALAEAIEGVPWTFHRAFDHTLDRDRAFRQVRGLPGLDSVLTAGSARGVEHGLDDLCRRGQADPELARSIIAGGGLRPEDVPWLVRAGVRSLHVGHSVRPSRSEKAYVDTGLVRSWRTLLDDTAAGVQAGDSAG